MALTTRIFDRLLEITLLFEADLARSFAGTALTPSRTHLLWVLHHQGPSTQRALAEALSVSPRNVTGLVDALVAAGYVERRPHPSDRRATLVTLTELGTKTMTGMARDREQIAAELVEGLAEDRLDELNRDLGMIAERLHALVESASQRPRISA
jgi:DNA-binding MarR family transcriptional regulator